MTDIQEIVTALRSDHCVHKTLADGTGVLLDLDGSTVLILNTTGMFLVEELIQRVDSFEDLVAALTTGFEVDRATAETDVRELLGQLQRHLG